MKLVSSCVATTRPNGKRVSSAQRVCFGGSLWREERASPGPRRQQRRARPLCLVIMDVVTRPLCLVIMDVVAHRGWAVVVMPDQLHRRAVPRLERVVDRRVFKHRRVQKSLKKKKKKTFYTKRKVLLVNCYEEKHFLECKRDQQQTVRRVACCILGLRVDLHSTWNSHLRGLRSVHLEFPSPQFHSEATVSTPTAAALESNVHL